MASDNSSPTMSEETNTTGSNGAQSNGPTTSDSQNHLKQKRARSQLSCTPCRQGKLRCNRQSPCDQCLKRNRETTCVFVPPPVKHKPAQNVKGRIRQLETLVVDLMNQNRNTQASDSEGKRRPSDAINGNATDEQQRNGPFSQPTPPSDNDTSPQFTSSCDRGSSDSPPDDVDAAAPLFGKLKISKNEISYVGDTHWGAILNSISDLKRDLSDGEEEEEEEEDPESPSQPQILSTWGGVPMGGAHPRSTTGLGFMLGDSSPVTREQLLSSVPEKRITDRLLSLWFNSPDPFKPIIHAPTFQDEYRRFWRSPKETPTMWLGLLYAIMSLAASFGLRDTDPSSPQAQRIMVEVNKYHSLAAGAAVAADFSRPKQYTIECLILYAAGLRSNNAFVNVWLMIGLIVRLALRMGYHRDASHYPAITVFQGEMRRRVWAVISMIDVLISFQLGLPSMVKTIQSDTQPPRNLLDRDFNSTTQVLPPSRSMDELTPSSYTRAKLRITRIFANAAELSHATVAPPQDEIRRLDRELEEAKAAVPPLLQMPDISELVTDPAEQLMCRFNLDLLYLKTKTVLHRRYMLTPLSQLTPREQARGIGDSHIACIDSALRVLRHHQTIYAASQPGGQLESVKWYMGSISTHDFLLAAMLICLELSTQIQTSALHICPRRAALMDALDKSSQIWSVTSGRKKKDVQFIAKDELNKGEHMFDETEKASRAMSYMIDKVKRSLDQSGQTPQRTNGEESGTSTADSTNGFQIGQDAFSQQHQPQNQRFFNGVLSTYNWGDMAGVPDVFDLNAAPFSNADAPNILAHDNQMPMNGTNGFSHSDSHDTTPDQPDFSLIDNMLDVPVNLDWDMWDSHMTGQQRQPYADFPDLSADVSAMPSINMRYGNALTGGTGPVMSSAADTVPGNDAMSGGNAAVMNDLSAVDFDMGMMGNGEFDFERLNYGQAHGAR